MPFAARRRASRRRHRGQSMTEFAFVLPGTDQHGSTGLPRETVRMYANASLGVGTTRA